MDFGLTSSRATMLTLTLNPAPSRLLRPSTHPRRFPFLPLPQLLFRFFLASRLLLVFRVSFNFRGCCVFFCLRLTSSRATMLTMTLNPAPSRLLRPSTHPRRFPFLPLPQLLFRFFLASRLLLVFRVSFNFRGCCVYTTSVTYLLCIRLYGIYSEPMNFWLRR